MRNKKLDYEINDPTLNYDAEKTEEDYLNEETKEETNNGDKRKKRIIIAILTVIVILLLLLGLGFGIKKNKIGAVLSDDVQEQMIDDFSSYLIDAGMTGPDADKTARELVKNNMGSLLLSDFMGMHEEEIQKMIEKAIKKNNKNYFTKTEIQTQIIDPFTQDLSELRQRIAANEKKIQELQEHDAETDRAIEQLNKDVSIKNLSTPLILYAWNKSFHNPSKDKWVVEEKKYDTSQMTIAEYVEILSKNDANISESINELAKDSGQKHIEIKENVENYKVEQKIQHDQDIENFNEYKEEVNVWQDKVDNQLNGHSLWSGTQAEYDALEDYDPDTFYFITE